MGSKMLAVEVQGLSTFQGYPSLIPKPGRQGYMIPVAPPPPSSLSVASTSTSWTIPLASSITTDLSQPITSPLLPSSAIGTYFVLDNFGFLLRRLDAFDVNI
jgi:hypothetical protein